MNNLQWKKYPVLNDGFVCLVDSMGDDSAIVQAARVSYGKDTRDQVINRIRGEEMHLSGNGDIPDEECLKEQEHKDRNLIRYLMSHYHTTPFEMVEFKFLVRVPMDCWRQWIRHRTASVNEYSTRYTEAIDSQQATSPQEWRLQAKNNKQGSSGFLEEWPEDEPDSEKSRGWTAGEWISSEEELFHRKARELYQERLALGVAKEQARKDLPLSTYTEAYWKINLHNLFHFLRLRMDSHAQLEIRQYANAIAEIVKQVVPVAWEAFEDYRLNAKNFSAMEMECLRKCVDASQSCNKSVVFSKPDSMTDREWKEFKEKLS